jgi:hypothetical protein
MKKAFDSALKDKQVKAIVLRIDSGGGDALASDTIWRYVVQAQEKNIKVIASIGLLNEYLSYLFQVMWLLLVGTTSLRLVTVLLLILDP